MLAVKNLHVGIDSEQILNDFNLVVEPGTIHALMGPNGSGKSTLACTLMGHPLYQVTSGTITFKNQELMLLTADKRAKLGLFLAFQHPLEIPGLTVATFLKEALQARTGISMGVAEFNKHLYMAMEQLSIDSSFAQRSLNVGFSGGEKKRLELLQMFILKPEIAILDEIDSGLDMDALKVVAAGILQIRRQNPAMSIIMITHYQRILDYVMPDYVHIVRSGSIVATGSASLVAQLEAEGYDAF